MIGNKSFNITLLSTSNKCFGRTFIHILFFTFSDRYMTYVKSKNRDKRLVSKVFI